MLPSSHRSQRALVVASVILLAFPSLGAAAHAADKLRFKAVADFTRCIDGYQAAPETCLELLDTFVKTNPAQAFAAGKAVRAKLTHAAAIPFFAKALTKGDRAACADPDVAMALVSGLDLSAQSGTTVAQALTILLDRCWAEAQTPVLKALGESGPSGFLAQNLCPKLAERRVANPSCEKKPVAAPVTVLEPRWKDIDSKAMTADGGAKVFKGAEGRSLTQVKLKNEDAYLIRFDGFRGEWNGRVLLHREAPVNSGYDYFTQVKGSRWVSVVFRDGVTQVYPSGDKGPFPVFYDDAASKTASAQTILEQFRQQKP